MQRVAVLLEELGILAGLTDQLVLLRERLRRLGDETIEGLRQQPLGDLTHDFVAGDMRGERDRNRLLNQPGRHSRHEVDDAPHALLGLSAAPIEEPLAQDLRVRPDVLSFLEQPPRLA